jgi:hypothetical protein
MQCCPSHELGAMFCYYYRLIDKRYTLKSNFLTGRNSDKCYNNIIEANIRLLNQLAEFLHMKNSIAPSQFLRAFHLVRSFNHCYLYKNFKTY